MERLSRILNVLLVVCSISFSTALVLAAYFVYQNGEIQNLKAELLSKNELQAELLKSQPLDQSLLPHINKEIGYVLNPHMQNSTWRASEGESYPINALGLRGPEIKRKEAGVTRVLLVGDSMFFGYKLREQEKLSHLLNKYTSQRLSDSERVEFVTIALPGWNIRSEIAFLESHLRLLDPDILIWWPIPNDIEDVAGAIPPGTLALWASPQAEHQTPFGGLSLFHKRNASGMPALAKRASDTWELITRFHAKYDIPIAIMSVMGLTIYPETDSFNPEHIDLPKIYGQDKRWALSATDSHPTGWANHIIAMGILRKLIQLGNIPEIEFAPEDIPILQSFKDEEIRLSGERGNGPHKPNSWNWLILTPTEFDSNDGKKSTGALYGIGYDGKMARAGTLFLRDPGNSSQVILNIALPQGMDKYPGTAKFSIRNRNLEERHAIVTMDSESVEVTLAVPEPSQNVPLYEISWLFDYSLCRGPSNCSVGKLLRARFK
jgi:hypothetical protein